MEEVMEICKNMNKICTSIPQSQRLMELGIDINTADMCHRYRWFKNNFILLPCVEHAKEPITGDIPAWSFTVLFNMLPKSARLEKGSSTELCRVNLPVELKCSDWYLDPIDAVFEIICTLKKEEYI